MQKRVVDTCQQAEEEEFKLTRNHNCCRVQYHGTTHRGGRTAHWEIDHLRSKVWRSTAVNDKNSKKSIASEEGNYGPVKARKGRNLTLTGKTFVFEYCSLPRPLFRKNVGSIFWRLQKIHEKVDLVSFYCQLRESTREDVGRCWGRPANIN